MSYSCACRIQLVWFALLMPACGSDGHAVEHVAVRAGSLEFGCASVQADFAGDYLSIAASIEPLDPARSQAYGSADCAAFVFEFDNPEQEQLRGAWVQAGGESRVDGDALSEQECATRTLEVNHWGYQKREWSILASARMSGTFERGYCRLDALIDYPNTLEKLRVVARVAQKSETYPMYACLW